MVSYSSRGPDVLDEENSLGLNNKEVDELMDIANHTINGFAGDGVVFAGSNLRGEAIVNDQLASSLSCDGDTEGNPRQLQAPSNDVEVASSEDEGDDGGIGDCRGTCDVDDQSGRLIRNRHSLTYGDCSTRGAQRRMSDSV